MPRLPTPPVFVSVLSEPDHLEVRDPARAIEAVGSNLLVEISASCNGGIRFIRENLRCE